MCVDEPRLAGNDCGGRFTTRVEQRRGNDPRIGDHQGHAAPSQQTLVRGSFFRHAAPLWIMLPGSAPSNKESVKLGVNHQPKPCKASAEGEKSSLSRRHTHHKELAGVTGCT